MRICCFGTFDLLHVGHVRLLKRARLEGDFLIVGLSTDSLNVEKKDRRPVVPFEQRKEMLLSLECVDEVFAEESLEDKRAYVRAHAIDVIVHGDDATLLQRLGGRRLRARLGRACDASAVVAHRRGGEAGEALPTAG